MGTDPNRQVYVYIYVYIIVMDRRICPTSVYFSDVLLVTKWAAPRY